MGTRPMVTSLAAHVCSCHFSQGLKKPWTAQALLINRARKVDTW